MGVPPECRVLALKTVKNFCVYINITFTGKQSPPFSSDLVRECACARDLRGRAKPRDARSEGSSLSLAIHLTDYTEKERLLVV